MARKTDSYLVDDLDGSRGAATVRFGLHGADYEIDLAAHHVTELESALTPYLQAARRVGRNGRTGRRTVARHAHLQAARQWLRANGHPIGEKGRIPKELLAMFESSQGGGTR